MSWAQYLTDVLGVRQIMWSESVLQAVADEAIATTAANEAAILFLAEPNEKAPLMQLEIFQRMIVAMKVEPTEYLVWELSTVDLAVQEKDIRPEQVIVSFSEKLTDWLSTQRPKLTVLSTFHPLDCERDPKLKRQVWETLKLALEKSELGARLQS